VPQGLRLRAGRFCDGLPTFLDVVKLASQLVEILRLERRTRRRSRSRWLDGSSVSVQRDGRRRLRTLLRGVDGRG
jgi:hypothetical protein